MFLPKPYDLFRIGPLLDYIIAARRIGVAGKKRGHGTRHRTRRGSATERDYAYHPSIPPRAKNSSSQWMW